MRALRHRPVPVVLLFAVLAVSGCGGGGSTEIPVGYAVDKDVPGPMRAELEKAVARFNERMENQDFHAVYEDAAGAARSGQSEEDFLKPLRGSFAELGVPQDMKTRRVIAVHFGEGFPHSEKVQCAVKGETNPIVLNLSDYPEQAVVVQTGRAKGETYYYSTLWLREGERWRLAAFFLRQATIMDKDWKAYEKIADEQRAANHSRNAALLYNTAMDLLVPNAWIEPPELPEIDQKQGQISVTHLPVKSVDLWPAGADTFRVFASSYAALPQLAVGFRYLTPAAMDDSTALRNYSNRLHDYVLENFPEYSEVFSALILQGTREDTPGRFWTMVYPLIKESEPSPAKESGP